MFVIIQMVRVHPSLDGGDGGRCIKGESTP